MNTLDLYKVYSVRTGDGQPSGSVQVTGGAPTSTFQVVRTLPPSQLNSVEYTRINMVWIPGNGTDSVQVAFGATSALATAALATQPLFTSALGILRFLMQPTDTGFIIQSKSGPAVIPQTPGTGTDNLYWWQG